MTKHDEAVKKLDTAIQAVADLVNEEIELIVAGLEVLEDRGGLNLKRGEAKDVAARIHQAIAEWSAASHEALETLTVEEDSDTPSPTRSTYEADLEAHWPCLQRLAAEGRADELISEVAEMLADLAVTRRQVEEKEEEAKDCAPGLAERDRAMDQGRRDRETLARKYDWCPTCGQGWDSAKRCSQVTKALNELRATQEEENRKAYEQHQKALGERDEAVRRCREVSRRLMDAEVARDQAVIDLDLARDDLNKARADRDEAERGKVLRQHAEDVVNAVMTNALKLGMKELEITEPLIEVRPGVFEAAARMEVQKPVDHIVVQFGQSAADRCAVCGTSLQERMEDGCVVGNCARRPKPTEFYDYDRALREGQVTPKEN